MSIEIHRFLLIPKDPADLLDEGGFDDQDPRGPRDFDFDDQMDPDHQTLPHLTNLPGLWESIDFGF